MTVPSRGSITHVGESPTRYSLEAPLLYVSSPTKLCNYVSEPDRGSPHGFDGLSIRVIWVYGVDPLVNECLNVCVVMVSNLRYSARVVDSMADSPSSVYCEKVSGVSFGKVLTVQTCVTMSTELSFSVEEDLSSPLILRFAACCSKLPASRPSAFANAYISSKSKPAIIACVPSL